MIKRHVGEDLVSFRVYGRPCGRTRVYKEGLITVLVTSKNPLTFGTRCRHNVHNVSPPGGRENVGKGDYGL